ncbi:SH3 domain-containing protein C23A1.17-like [Vigna umbellata]|uniref:SH3 domain-containing protein C23A1.17-like n=1 Tax=Vigna umbellata TaxID=87088 RepID=UPI001F5E7E49|nr:SH3 domain-containing protein C23A1.17-like [Vigna umbellata]
MIGQGSERPDKGKGVGRPKKRQRQAPKYVLRVPGTLPSIAAPGTSSMAPPPTPTVAPPPTPTVQPSPTPTVQPSPTPAAHRSTTPAADPLPPPVIINPTPSPVVITPTPLPDPTSIPSSSTIPPSQTVTPSAEPDSSGDGDGLTRPSMIDHGLSRMMKVQWKPEHESKIHRNFHMKASHRLSEMFRDARNVGQRPYWMGEQIWNSLLAHWNTVEFRNKCAKAQRNRASEKGGTLHTGGSITIHEHAIRMAQALGRAVHVDEVFAQTHVRKGTNQFEEFSTRLSQVRSEHESAPTPDDARQLAANYTTSRGGTLKHQPSSSTTAPEEVVVRLTQALEQRDQELTDLRVEFTNFKALVMRVLPETSQDV